MRFFVSDIITNHYRSFTPADKKTLIRNYLIMLIFPLIAPIMIFWVPVSDKNSLYSISISVFSIFAALLFSVQIALYGIFQSKKNFSSDEKIKKIQEGNFELRDELLRTLNYNVSYLILFCIVALTILLSFDLFNMSALGEQYVSLVLYLHFGISVTLVLGRAHTLFDNEYIG